MARKRPTFRSEMENHPEHVHALGMVSIVYAQMEISLSLVMGHMLELAPVVSHSIYFTPNAVNVRLDIVRRVAETTLAKDHKKRRRILRFVNTANDVANERNRLIHDLWFSPDMASVEQIRLPHRTRRKVELKEIESLVEKLGQLIDDMHQFFLDVDEFPTLSTSYSDAGLSRKRPPPTKPTSDK